MRKLIAFLLLLVCTCQFRETMASRDDGVRNDMYRARAGMLAHVYTANEESLTERSKNSSDSLLCDRRGVPGS